MGCALRLFERFGGVRVYSLLRASDGATWVGGLESGLYVLRDGKVQSWHEADGIAKGTVYSLLEDRLHRIWAVSNSGLLRMDQGRPRLIVHQADVNGPTWQSINEDSGGALWFAAKEGLFRVSNGVKAMRLTGTRGLPLTIYYSPVQRSSTSERPRYGRFHPALD
jgi:ligand-binding sensor domain-containing protein